MHTTELRLPRPWVLHRKKHETRLSTHKVKSRLPRSWVLGKIWNKAMHAHSKVKATKVLGPPLGQNWKKAKHAQNEIKAADVLGTPVKKHKARHAQSKVKAAEVLGTPLEQKTETRQGMRTAKLRMRRSWDLHWHKTDTHAQNKVKATEVLGSPLEQNCNAARHAHSKVKDAKALAPWTKTETRLSMHKAKPSLPRSWIVHWKKKLKCC